MLLNEIKQKRVCNACVGEEFLAGLIESSSIVNVCDYCGESNFTITAEQLSDYVDEAMQSHFCLTRRDPTGIESSYISWGFADHWDRPGERVGFVIGDIAAIEPEIVGDVLKLLSGRYVRDAFEGGEEDPYDDEAHYEEREHYGDTFDHTWDGFRSLVQHRSRFFDSSVAQMLDDIFGDLQSLQAHSARKFIVNIDPEEEELQIWRARNAGSHRELEMVMQNPYRELGPPPSSKAYAGRMNPSGIAVFYGAKEIATCISEIRAPVGSYVVLACFNLVRPVRLLDLGALAQAPVTGSYFDTDFIKRKERAGFLTRIIEEMSKPIMPQDETIEYITTQIVAEYLKNHGKYNGLIFPSTQTDGNADNLVLFNGSCGVEVPFGTVDNDVNVGPEYDLDMSVGDSVETGREGVWIQQHDSVKNEDNKQGSDRYQDIFLDSTNETDQESCTIRLIKNKIEIVRIKQVNPSWENLAVSWF